MASDSKEIVYIWADANETIGYGHFVRSLALADMIKEHFDCSFYTQTPTHYQEKEVLKVCKLVPLPSDDTKFDRFLQLLSGNEIVVLDNYFFSSEYQKQIKQKGCKLICLGTNDKYYYADIVINFVLQENDFEAESYTKFCLGFQWMPIRQSFLCATRRIKTLSNAMNAVICYGGTDQFQLTEKTIPVLKRISRIADIHIISTDVIGSSRIDDFVRQGIKMHINVSAEEIAHVFSSCDIAILSASSVAMEAIASHIPVIAGYYVDNQEKLYSYLCENHYIIGVGNMRDNNFPETLFSILNDLSSYVSETKSIDNKNIRSNYIRLLSTL